MLLLGYILFLPFHRAYAAGYSSIELWRGSRTLLDAYLTMHGIVLFVIVTALMARVSSPFNRAPLAREIRLLLRQGYRAPRLFRLSKRIVHRSELQRAGMGMVGAGVVVLLALVGIIGAAGLERIIRPVVGFETWLSVIGPSTLAFFVVALCAALLFEPRADARHRFLLTIIAFGAILTVAVEIVVLKGDIGRMNTVFKFYLQVWTLWSIAAAACVPGLLGQYRDRASVRQSFPQLPSYGVAEWWRPTFAALAIAGLLYPLFATYARAQDRFENSRQLTLDGLAYMDNAVYNDKNQPIPLIWDRQAIDWLLLNVEGSPVIVEAVTPLYRWGSRISVNTGLPTVIGWDWHQKQQRAALPGDLIDRRVTDVNQIFGSASPERTAELLRRYSVRLLYVGQLERLYYPGVEAKMRGYEGTLWNRVYDNQEVSIYEVRPD
jgi:uncharacterized membrane protein